MEGQEKDRSPVCRRRSTSESGTDARLSSTLDEFVESGRRDKHIILIFYAHFKGLRSCEMEIR